MRQPGEPDMSFAYGDEAQITLPGHETAFAIRTSSPHTVRNAIVGMLACLGISAAALAAVKRNTSSPHQIQPENIPPPDPAAIQECYRRLLSNIQPGFDSGLRTARFSNHGYYPMAQAITADGQTECSATLAIQAMRVQRAVRGR